ncbi:MAG: Stage V sporulation protein T, AbrB family transcriptional regulator (SpoVT) [Brockia lithotrophica]|uniref:Stage V sporulation protein T, AbrB family transcriptional regulator (SpoVT) n=1 Tax=Brockia lithotrophica TaxID=933949 RepID=A0A2T5G564_9BACL|nr:AbrB/MazE/SpoVT family DNA-binding domain-containing protein [Brockia lithotrophica]MBT9253766.1 AbrB/MazE/SpoVT family DNA-binding domain-containing protein [Brockia lithotrophica]PTQ51308.1 MAG: Stage V sporulation protein T, AbrB family transcriptional regulator (SpoVT) [Brockia lithotrophica]
MKATGIVRRIDDLGRVVIPKEIRRTLRIREGDPLEIFVDQDGEVILKKYSPVLELGEFAQSVAASLYDTFGLTVLVTDRDRVVAVAGPGKKDFQEREIGPLVERAMEDRRTYREGAGEVELFSQGSERVGGVVVAPIVVGGDPMGTVILLSREEPVALGEAHVKGVEVAAAFLAKQLGA